MPDDEHPSGRPTSRPFSGGRLAGFSDGVFSIAATLLVLEISVPSGSGDDLLGAFLGQWPSYLGYLVSFATIGGTWLAHNVITEYVHHVDPVFARLNLLLLMSVAFLPFPTRLIAEYTGEPSAERVAATVYGLTLIAVALLLSGLWRYAVRRRLVHPDVDDTAVRLITRRLEPSLGGYVVLLVVGLFLPLVAVFGYLAIAIYLILPVRHRARR